MSMILILENVILVCLSGCIERNLSKVIITLTISNSIVGIFEKRLVGLVVLMLD